MTTGPGTGPPDEPVSDVLVWDTLAEAMAAGSEYARLACTPLSTNDPGLMWATLAVASQLRALTLMLQTEGLTTSTYNLVP